MYKYILAFTIHTYYLLSKIVSIFYKKNAEKDSILYLTAFFPGNSGYQWRVKEWALLLEKEGYKVDMLHAIDEESFYKYKDKNPSLFHVIFLKNRFKQVLQARKYEKVIVRRDLLLYNDYGNLFLEKLLLKINPNTILDFDDDLAFSKKEPREINSLFGKLLLENGDKFTKSLNLYNNFFVGSNYLKNYVLQRNKNANIQIIPTCVAYDNEIPKKYEQKEEIVFGWIGGNHNLFLLETIIEPLNELAKKHNISLLVIAGREYKNDKANFKIRNIAWSLETEVESMKQMDVGVMPLLNTLRDKGKAGFKLIQYMGLGIVSVASGVTVNTEIVDNEKDGFLVFDNNWQNILEKVIENKNQFGSLGLAAREKIITKYSFTSNFKLYLNFLKKI